jgi:transglutaminase-like putative cysteine protease
METPALLLTLPDDPVASARETLKRMRLLVLDGKTQPAIRQAAMSIVRARGIPPMDFLGEMRALWHWVLTRIRYTRDINNVETVHFADQILRQRAGDCDDVSILLASLLEAIGFQTRFVAVAFSPGNFDHVLVEAEHDGAWFALDATEPKPFGWFPPDVYESMIIHNRECEGRAQWQ